MPEYMLLLYAGEADKTESARRWAEMPLWDEVTDSLREAGLLIANGALRPVETATTVRVRDGETEITDGPFDQVYPIYLPAGRVFFVTNENVEGPAVPQFQDEYERARTAQL